MGITSVTLEVKNPANSKLKVRSEFLVDSGASYTVIPKEMAKKLKLKPSFEQSFTLADGRVIKRKISNTLIKYRGREVASPVVLGKKNDIPLLGVLTLEALGLTLDPFERKLYRAKLML